MVGLASIETETKTCVSCKTRNARVNRDNKVPHCAGDVIDILGE